LNIAIELKNLKDSKISNIAITINKVVRILKQMNTDAPPIRKMRDEEVFNALWSSYDSVKYQVIEVLNTMEKSDETETCFNFISSVDEDDADSDEHMKNEDE